MRINANKHPSLLCLGTTFSRSSSGGSIPVQVLSEKPDETVPGSPEGCIRKRIQACAGSHILNKFTRKTVIEEDNTPTGE